MTIKLYDEDSYAAEFEATVISCEQTKKGYRTELDKTLFFPEEGGQCSDRGILGGEKVYYVETDNEKIYHHTKNFIKPGEKISGKIDFNLRFRNMQNHSGEHIICGIAHKLFGCENVGFHLGEDNVTMDLDLELSDEDIEKIEFLANKAVAENLKVEAFYPSKKELFEISYRSKGEIEGRVRIVKIGDVDICACCAPHVRNTGEIGIIKITDYMRHRGGMRFTIKCGYDAFFDYKEKHNNSKKISNMLSVKIENTDQGVRKLLDDISLLKARLGEKDRQIADIVAASVEFRESDICILCENFDMDQLRKTAEVLKNKTKGVAVVCSNDEKNGCRYVISSCRDDISECVKNANAALSGRGGGRGNIASGSFGEPFEKVKSYFE